MIPLLKGKERHNFWIHKERIIFFRQKQHCIPFNCSNCPWTEGFLSISAFIRCASLKYALVLALVLARSPVFSKRTKRKKNNVFVQASKGPHLARSGLIKEKFSFLGLFWLSNQFFINQDCSVKLPEYWTCYSTFFSFLWTVEPRYNEGLRD